MRRWIGYILVGCVALLTFAAYPMAIIVVARWESEHIVAAYVRAHPASLKLRDLSKRKQDILLAVEDPNFYEHHGVDLTTPGAGITTISQGLVKLLYFENFQPGFAKLKQTLIARFVYDPLTSKEEQLRLFVNAVYLGQQDGEAVNGFARAARVYFGKPFDRLNDDEYLALVAMIIAPNAFHVLERPAANRERVRRIRQLIAGEYRPKSLMDLYYGPVDARTQTMLPAASYFPDLYR